MPQAFCPSGGPHQVHLPLSEALPGKQRKASASSATMNRQTGSCWYARWNSNPLRRENETTEYQTPLRVRFHQQRALPAPGLNLKSETKHFETSAPERKVALNWCGAVEETPCGLLPHGDFFGAQQPRRPKLRCKAAVKLLLLKINYQLTETH